MPVIFGWGKNTTWEVGPVFRQHCSHCNNDEFWGLMRRTTWLTLFFIPVIPYKTQWWLLCPVCKYGITLKDEQVKQLQPIAEVNQLLATKQITEVEYQRRVALLNNTPATTTEPPALEETKVEIKEEVRSTATYCGDCGKEVVPDGRFCVHCGSKVNEETA